MMPSLSEQPAVAATYVVEPGQVIPGTNKIARVRIDMINLNVPCLSQTDPTKVSTPSLIA